MVRIGVSLEQEEYWENSEVTESQDGSFCPFLFPLLPIR